MTPDLNVRIAHIVEAVAGAFGIPKTYLCRPGTATRARRARYLVFLLARELGGFPPEQVAHTMRCHVRTVSTGASRARRWLEEEPDFRAVRERVEAKLCRRPSSTATKTE